LDPLQDGADRPAGKLFMLERHPADVMILHTPQATAALNPVCRGHAPPGCAP
jgi:hypothetical protein